MLIQRMRDSTEGIMAKIIIGLICIVFALFGFGSITTFFAPVAKVATVNGEDITQQEMELNVERRRRMLMSSDMPVNEDQLREDVLNSLITRTVLSQATSGLNLHYGDAELDAEIVHNPVFMLDGEFNSLQFQQVLGGAGFTPLTYRAEMRKDKMFDQLITGIQQSAFITQGEAKRYTGLLSQRRDIAYIQIFASDLIEQVDVHDEEVAQYYNTNLSDFITAETVALQFIELNRDELAATYEVDELELEEYFLDNKIAYSIDESRKVAHILIETTSGFNETAALQKAESVYQRVATGEDFSLVAQEVSDDLGSRENGGDLGFNQRGVFPAEFELVAFNLLRNGVSKPVKTDAGYHIIKVLAIEEAFSPELSDVRGKVEQAYRYEVTEGEFITKSSRMAEMLFENFSELESIADALGLEVRSTGHLERNAEPAQGLLTWPGISDAAFSADVLLDGNNSDLIEISDDLHMGIRVAEHNPSKAKSLEEVKQDVRYILQRQKAARLADLKAQEIVGAIKAGSLAQFVADEYGYEWKLLPAVTLFDSEVEPALLAEAFKLPRPFQNKETVDSAVFPNGDAVVLRLSRVLSPDEDQVLSEELADIRVTLIEQSGMNDFDDFQESLKLEAALERVN